MISQKIRNLTDTLEAQADEEILSPSMFKLAMDTLRVIAEEVRAIENQPIPDARRYADMPGIVDFVAEKDRREIDAYLVSQGITVAPCDTDPGGAA